MDLNEAKLEQLNVVRAFRAYGHAIELGQDGGAVSGLAASKSWVPIRPCYCVQDSPQNPCRCNKGIVWWLWRDAIISQGKSARKDHDDMELQFFDVLVESKVMVETLQPVSAGALKALGASRSTGRGLVLTGGTGGGTPGTIADLASTLWTVGGALFLMFLKDSGVLDDVTVLVKKMAEEQQGEAS